MSNSPSRRTSSPAQAGHSSTVSIASARSGVVEDEAVEQGGRRGRPSLEEPSLANDAQVGFHRLLLMGAGI